MARYEVFDCETTVKKSYGRKANPFDPENWVVLRQYKVQGEQATYHYFGANSYKTGAVVPGERELNMRVPMYIPEDVSMLVGHNIKFDLEWTWAVPGMREFLKRGGLIWDTQYAEYLLQGMERTWHMNSLNDCCNLYGVPLKEDAVKEFWEQGYDTWQIPPDILISYGLGDVDRTEEVYKKQWNRAIQLGMLGMILQRMEGLLATTDMEWNGFFVDKELGLKKADEAWAEVAALQAKLNAYLPSDFPKEANFNWGSRHHKSALFYGGDIKYTVKMPILDENGDQTYAKKKVAYWVVESGGAEVLGFPVDAQTAPPDNVKRYKSGKRMGEAISKQVDVNNYDKPKFQNMDMVYTLPRLCTPLPEWEYLDEVGMPTGYYSTAEEVLMILLEQGVPFVSDYMRLAKLTKDVGTYYIKYDSDQNPKGGMLTLVYPDGIVHHKLNHTSTVTGRLSSSDPNGQNFPRADKSTLKELFCSRWGADGRMIEVDYSQLEVVIQGMLSRDPQLVADLKARIDFHCKRVSARYGCTYEEALQWAKKDEIPEWKERRTNCKEFSFQRAYGAGAAAISLSTGIPVEDVKLLIEAEEQMYPGVVDYQALKAREVEDNAVPCEGVYYRSKRNQQLVVQAKRGYYTSPTGTRYVFTEQEAPDFLQRKGVVCSFSPTEEKNYEIQGTGGEAVQMTAGRLFRWFCQNDNFSTDGNWRNGRAYLCNTVHDCFWADAKAEIAPQIATGIRTIMEQIGAYINSLYPHMKVDVPFPAEAEIGLNLLDKKVVH